MVANTATIIDANILHNYIHNPNEEDHGEIIKMTAEQLAINLQGMKAEHTEELKEKVDKVDLEKRIKYHEGEEHNAEKEVHDDLSTWSDSYDKKLRKAHLEVLYSHLYEVEGKTDNVKIVLEIPGAKEQAAKEQATKAKEQETKEKGDKTDESKNFSGRISVLGQKLCNLPGYSNHELQICIAINVLSKGTIASVSNFKNRLAPTATLNSMPDYFIDLRIHACKLLGFCTIEDDGSINVIKDFKEHLDGLIDGSLSIPVRSDPKTLKNEQERLYWNEITKNIKELQIKLGKLEGYKNYSDVYNVIIILASKRFATLEELKNEIKTKLLGSRSQELIDKLLYIASMLGFCKIETNGKVLYYKDFNKRIVQILGSVPPRKEPEKSDEEKYKEKFLHAIREKYISLKDKEEVDFLNFIISIKNDFGANRNAEYESFVKFGALFNGISDIKRRYEGKGKNRKIIIEGIDQQGNNNNQQNTGGNQQGNNNNQQNTGGNQQGNNNNQQNTGNNQQNNQRNFDLPTHFSVPLSWVVYDGKDISLAGQPLSSADRQRIAENWNQAMRYVVSQLGNLYNTSSDVSRKLEIEALYNMIVYPGANVVQVFSGIKKIFKEHMDYRIYDLFEGVVFTLTAQDVVGTGWQSTKTALMIEAKNNPALLTRIHTYNQFDNGEMQKFRNFCKSVGLTPLAGEDIKNMQMRYLIRYFEAIEYSGTIHKILNRKISLQEALAGGVDINENTFGDDRVLNAFVSANRPHGEMGVMQEYLGLTKQTIEGQEGNNLYTSYKATLHGVKRKLMTLFGQGDTIRSEDERQLQQMTSMVYPQTSEAANETILDPKKYFGIEKVSYNPSKMSQGEIHCSIYIQGLPTPLIIIGTHANMFENIQRAIWQIDLSATGKNVREQHQVRLMACALYSQIAIKPMIEQFGVIMDHKDEGRYFGIDKDGNVEYHLGDVSTWSMENIQEMIQHHQDKALPHILQIAREMQHSCVVKAVEYYRGKEELKKASQKRTGNDPLYAKQLTTDNVKPLYGQKKVENNVKVPKKDATGKIIKGQFVDEIRESTVDDTENITRRPLPNEEHIGAFSFYNYTDAQGIKITRRCMTDKDGQMSYIKTTSNDAGNVHIARRATSLAEVFDESPKDDDVAIQASYTKQLFQMYTRMVVQRKNSKIVTNLSKEYIGYYPAMYVKHHGTWYRTLVDDQGNPTNLVPQKIVQGADVDKFESKMKKSFGLRRRLRENMQDWKNDISYNVDCFLDIDKTTTPFEDDTDNNNISFEQICRDPKFLISFQEELMLSLRQRASITGKTKDFWDKVKNAPKAIKTSWGKSGARVNI